MSLDFTLMIENAFNLLTSLWPIFAIPISFALGLGLLDKITKGIRDSMR